MICNKDNRFLITQHVRERFWERTHIKKYQHLQHCRVEQCPTCEALFKEAREEIKPIKTELDQTIFERLMNSQEEKSYLNNSNFMEWYYAKYGFDHIPYFLVHDDLVFIVMQKKGRRVVVTCVTAKTHVVGKCSCRKKFKREKGEI